MSGATRRPSLVGSTSQVDARTFGVVGDGTNQTTALQAAVAAAGTDKTVQLPAGDIPLDYMSFASAARIQGVPGKTRLFLNSRVSTQMVPNTTNGNGMLHFKGSKAAGDLLTVDAPARALTITIGANAANYTEGDVCILRSTALYPGTNKNARVGEYVRVRSSDGTAGTVTFRGYTDFSYATSDGAILEKVTPLDGVVLRDLIVRGDGIAFSTNYEQFPIYLTYCRGALIENVTMERIDGRCITLWSCLNCDVVDPKFIKISNTGEDATVGLRRYGYGVDLSECTRDCTVHAPKMVGGRHCVTCNAWGGGPDPVQMNGIPAYNKVFGGHAREMTAAGFDWHIEGYMNEFHDCTTHSSQLQGFQLRCNGAKAYNCVARNVEGIGMSIGDGVYAPPNVVVVNPVIQGVRANTELQSGSTGITQPGYGMRICGDNPVVRNPIIEDTDDVAIRVDAGTVGLRVEGYVRFRRTGLSGTAGKGDCIQLFGSTTTATHGSRFGILDGDACERLVGLASGATTWDSTVEDLIVGTTVAASAATPSGGILAPVRPRGSRQNVLLVDDFHDLSATGRIGTLGWTKGGGAGSGIAPLAALSNHPGIVQLSTGATISTAAWLQLAADATKGVVFASDTWEMEAVARGNHDSHTIVRIGLMTDPSVAITAGCYFEKLAADTNWFAVNMAASVSTRTDTGVSAVSGSVWRNLTLRRYGSAHTGLSIDAGQDIIIASNRPAVALVPVLYIANDNASSKTLDIDYVKLGVGGMIR